MLVASRRPQIGALGQASRVPRAGEVKAAAAAFFMPCKYQGLAPGLVSVPDVSNEAPLIYREFHGCSAAVDQ
jgi:hypothetical protein